MQLDIDAISDSLRMLESSTSGISVIDCDEDIQGKIEGLQSKRNTIDTAMESLRSQLMATQSKLNNEERILNNLKNDKQLLEAKSDSVSVLQSRINEAQRYCVYCQCHH